MWWCPTCEEWLEWDEVTYEETHDERIGGCGERVLPDKPEDECDDCAHGGPENCRGCMD